MKITTHIPTYSSGSSIPPNVVAESVVMAIIMAKTIGTTANRVSIPAMTISEHPTSTRIIITSDAAAPQPIGSGNPSRSAPKFNSLAIPCESIMPPTKRRNTKRAKFIYRSESRNRSHGF